MDIISTAQVVCAISVAGKLRHRVIALIRTNRAKLLGMGAAHPQCLTIGDIRYRADCIHGILSVLWIRLLGSILRPSRRQTRYSNAGRGKNCTSKERSWRESTDMSSIAQEQMCSLVG
jgi:hypothetical protein